MLATPSGKAITIIKAYSPQGVIELGAGQGHWLKCLRKNGVSCYGYDINPKGSAVKFGNHLAAAREYKGETLLIVWPPDGEAVADWIAAWPGDVIILCGAFARFDTGAALDDFDEVELIHLPPGHKGGSTLKVFKRS